MIELKSYLEDLMPSRWRVTVYLPEEMQKALEHWAANENRSTSNLAATILINAIKEYQDNAQHNETPTTSNAKARGKKGQDD